MENNNRLMRALIIGAVLAGAAVGLFLLMYFVVLAGAENTSKLFGALLVPPLVLAVVMAAYFIYSQGRKN